MSEISFGVLEICFKKAGLGGSGRYPGERNAAVSGPTFSYSCLGSADKFGGRGGRRKELLVETRVGVVVLAVFGLSCVMFI